MFIYSIFICLLINLLTFMHLFKQTILQSINLQPYTHVKKWNTPLKL